MTHRLRRLALVMPCVFYALLLAIPVGVHATPSNQPIPLTDGSAVLDIPGVARPALRVPTVDPAFGTTITRIGGDTGTSTFSVRGTWGADARHSYSKQQPWNADGSLLVLQNRAGGTPSKLFLDGSIYLPRFGPCPSDPLYDYRWHPSAARATTMINVNSAGTELMWYDVATCTKTRSWSLPIVADYGIGSGEGNPSNDGRFVCISNETSMVLVDMDPQPPYAPYPAQRMGPVYPLLPCDLDSSDPSGNCRIGNISISPSGRYVDVKFSTSEDATQDLHRIFEVDPVTLALKPHTMDIASLRCDSFAERTDGWIYPLKHADMTLDPFDGNEDVLVGGRSCPGSALGRVLKVRLRDGKVTPLTDPSNEPSFQHASARNVNRPGWVYVGYYKSSGRKYSDEVVAVKLDGSLEVERYVHKRSATSGCYRCESHPVPSRDGQRILFASNWAVDCTGQCGGESDIKAYVVSLPTRIDSEPAPVSSAVALAVERVVPRPAATRVALGYVLGTDEAVRFDLVDASGRLVEQRDLGRPGPGTHQVMLERTRAMRAGIYWGRFITASGTATARVIFVWN
jgi:hypothetical protein